MKKLLITPLLLSSLFTYSAETNDQLEFRINYSVFNTNQGQVEQFIEDGTKKCNQVRVRALFSKLSRSRNKQTCYKNLRQDLNDNFVNVYTTANPLDQSKIESAVAKRNNHFGEEVLEMKKVSESEEIKILVKEIKNIKKYSQISRVLLTLDYNGANKRVGNLKTPMKVNYSIITNVSKINFTREEKYGNISLESKVESILKDILNMAKEKKQAFEDYTASQRQRMEQIKENRREEAIYTQEVMSIFN